MKRTISVSRLFDILYQRGQDVLYEHNPCQFKTDKKGKLTCVGGTPCCPTSCEHLTPVGCGAKVLACKLYLCGAARDKSPRADAALWELREVAFNAGVPMTYYRSKAQLGLK